MNTSHSRHRRFFLLGLFIGANVLLTGCNDASKTSGTQVVEDPAAVAHRKAKGENYKGGAPKKPAKGAVKKD